MNPNEKKSVYIELEKALEYGDEEKVKELIKKHGKEYFESFGMYGMPLLCIIVDIKKDELLKWLIEQGWNIEETDGTGDTALFYAANGRKKDMFLYLLEKGSNMDHQCDVGGTVLMDAMYRGEYEIVEILYEKGSDMNIRDDEGKDFLDHLVWKDKQNLENLFDRFLETPERFDKSLLKKIKAKRMELLF